MIRHVFEKIRQIEKLSGRGCYVTLEDGTLIGLPLSAENNYKDFQKGDEVLVDADKWLAGKGMANVTVFRQGRMYSHFGIGGNCQLDIVLLGDGAASQQKIVSPQATSAPTPAGVLLEIFGWYGVVAIVGAYVLISFDYLTAHSLWYQVLNSAGAVGVVSVSFYKKVYQPAVLNVIWALIALVAIINILR